VYKKILVPLDSSKLADMILPYAEVLAGALNSRVTLLYVCETEEEHYLRVHQFYLGKIAELVKSHIREDYPETKATNVNVKSAVVTGKPSEEISQYATKNDMDLIILAGRGRTNIMRRLMGDIADRVFQATGKPLLLISSKPYQQPSPRQLLNRILLPLDGSANQEAILPYIMELARKLYAEVILFQVLTSQQQLRTTRRVEYVRFTKQQLESMKTEAERHLGDIRRKLAKTGASVQYEVRIADDPATEITHFARERDVRLLAIATRRYAGIRRFFAGSVAQRVLQNTDKPVLLVRMPD
jgi:nucleotide-binding universal stress UspA family protein